MTDADLPAVAAALTDAFAGYPVELAFTPDVLRAMIDRDGVVPGLCRLARGPDGGIVGVGLAARRGDRGRVAAMGVVRRAHRGGVGRAVGEAVIAALTRAGVREIVLEALTVNHSALALYEGPLGFVPRRRLVGFERSGGGRPVTSEEWDGALGANSEPDSWQLPEVIRLARAATDLVSVPAVVPERHAVAELLRSAGFAEGPVDQYELGRALAG